MHIYDSSYTLLTYNNVGSKFQRVYILYYISDVWSFGCVMYEIWSLGHEPFEGYTNSQVRSLYMTCQLSIRLCFQTLKLVEAGIRLSPPPGCPRPRPIYSLMMQCWYILSKSLFLQFSTVCVSGIRISSLILSG